MELSPAPSRVFLFKSRRLPQFLPDLPAMILMYADMSDAQQNRCCQKKRILSVDSQKQKGADRQGRSRHRHSQKAPIKVPHGFFASEISNPVALVQKHTDKRRPQPQRPQGEILNIIIGKISTRQQTSTSPPRSRATRTLFSPPVYLS